MTWSDLPRNPPSKALRQFSAAWLVVFLALGLHHWLARGHDRVGPALCVLAVSVGGLGLARPRAVGWLFLASMVVAFPVGWVLSLLMLAIMYYGIITPVALVFRLRGRDLLCSKPAPGRPSFWVARQMPGDIRRYFKQY
jgi:hypothetical protein